MLTYRRKGRNEERPLRVKAKRYEHVRRARSLLGAAPEPDGLKDV